MCIYKKAVVVTLAILRNKISQNLSCCALRSEPV